MGGESGAKWHGMVGKVLSKVTVLDSGILAVGVDLQCGVVYYFVPLVS